MVAYNENGSGQIPLPIQFGDKASFENFWVGHNTELIAAIKAAIQKGEPRMLYMYGAAGSGKSHLLFAAMRFAKEQILHNCYLSLKDAYAQPSMLEVLDVHHLVCLDNIQAWAGDEERERALFSLFERIKSGGGQLIVTATQAADASGFDLPDLVSRLNSGLLYPVHALTDEQQFEAIKLRASQRGLSIGDDAVKFLLKRATRDTTELFAILDEIDRASLIEKRRITIPFLQGLLAK